MRRARKAMISTSSCATRKCSASSSCRAFSPPRSAAPTNACCAPPSSTSAPPMRFPAPIRTVLTEAECDTLKRNNNAVYAFIGFKQVDNPVNKLRMTFPAGLLPPEAKPSDQSWQEYENPQGQPRRHRRVPRLGARILHQLVLARLPVVQRAATHLHPQFRIGADRRRRRQPLGVALLLPQHDVRVSGRAARHLHPLRHEAARGLRAAAGDPARGTPRKDSKADRQALFGGRRRCGAADRGRSRLVADRARRIQHRRLRLLRSERLARADDDELRVRHRQARTPRRRAHRLRDDADHRQQRRRHDHHVRQLGERQDHLRLRAGEPAPARA